MKGDTIAFTVTSDEPGEVHVHGYELMQDVTPDAPATVSFEATIDGIFDVELHYADDEIEIAKLTVNQSIVNSRVAVASVVCAIAPSNSARDAAPAEAESAGRADSAYKVAT